MSDNPLNCKYCGIDVSEWNMGGVDIIKGQLICSKCADPKLPNFLKGRLPTREEYANRNNR